MKIVPMSAELIDSMGSDLSVVNAARVSFHKESDWEYAAELGGHWSSAYLGEKDQKLISYLAKHGHWTPFGHAFLSFRIKAPIFVARQLVKHQVGLVWNEVSRRYVDEEPEFWLPETIHKRPEDKIKQGASETAIDYVSAWLDTMKENTRNQLAVYQGLLGAGAAPEEARIVLPLNTHTEWIWSGSLAAFARVCKLRMAKQGVQGATKEAVTMLNNLIPETFQHSWKALTQ